MDTGRARKRKKVVFNLDPVLIKLGPFQIRYYGLLFMGAFLSAYFITKTIFKREGRDVTQVDTLLLYMMIGTVVGARLGHVLFYDLGYYIKHPVEILEPWKGGLASHGAAIGLAIATALFIRKTDWRFIPLADRLVIPISLSTCFVRLGNFFNSEIVGRPTNLPWGIKFLRYKPWEPIVPRHPSQIYEVIMGLFTFIILWYTYKKKGANPEGLLFYLFLSIYFSLRFIVEFFKEYQTLPKWFPLTMGQLLSLPFIGVGTYGLYRLYRERKGQITSF